MLRQREHANEHTRAVLFVFCVITRPTPTGPRDARPDDRLASRPGDPALNDSLPAASKLDCRVFARQ